MMALPQLKTNRTSKAYVRITAAGFTIGEPDVRDTFGDISLMCTFTCVCGRTESFHKMLRGYEPRFFKHDDLFKNGWDVALELERFGSVSVDHLKKDGFSEQEIKRIRYVYDLEDELIELRKVKILYEHYTLQYMVPHESQRG